jgi:hypothetical protein
VPCASSRTSVWTSRVRRVYFWATATTVTAGERPVAPPLRFSASLYYTVSEDALSDLLDSGVRTAHNK